VKVYFHLSGRLGNQLFQWAYIHELIERKIEVEIFVDKFHNDVDRVDLERLLSVCTHLPVLKIRNDLGYLLRVAEKLKTLGGVFELISRILPICIEEASLRNRWRFLPIIMDGYFIDKRWAEKHQDTLVGELKVLLDQIPDEIFMGEISDIKSHTMIHVRRGDFKMFMTTFGLLSKDYYLKLIDETESILVLTDSFKEAKLMFCDIERVQIIDPAKYDGWAALKIISRSDRFLMSNSTLAWWGGYLALKLNHAGVIIPRPIYFKPSEFDQKLALFGFTPAQSIFE